MEHWQSALLEAAQSMSLEARCYGNGLPGSSVSVSVPPVTINNGSFQFEYTGIEIVIFDNGGYLRFEAYQDCFGVRMHPHTNRSAMCFGENRVYLEDDWLRVSIASCVPDDFIPPLVRTLSAIQVYTRVGAYHDGGRVWLGCRCLAEQFPDSVPRGLNLENAPACEHCIHTCRLCSTRIFKGSGVYIQENGRSILVCGECAQQEFSFCGGCGRRVTRKMHCPVTNLEICNSCGVTYRDQLYHMSACVTFGYDYVPANLFTHCRGCNRAVPSDPSIDPHSVVCDDSVSCFYYRDLIMSRSERYVAISQ